MSLAAAIPTDDVPTMNPFSLDEFTSTLKSTAYSGKQIIVYFWAEWCGPCKMFSPLMEEIAEEREDVELIKVDVDQETDLAASFDITAIPTLLFFKNGNTNLPPLLGAASKKAVLKHIDQDDFGN